jgi:aldose 1-epimerase
MTQAPAPSGVRAPMPALRQPFGHAPDGQAVELVEIGDGAGMTARLITWGAALQALTAPDRNGRFADIVLGHDTLAPYVERCFYIGATVGRFANRIAGAAFTLDGRTHQLSPSNGPNTLHGGVKGFHHVVWQIAEQSPSRVVFARLSPAGEEGFPGALAARVTYAFDRAGELTVSFEATTDAPTVVNITHHSRRRRLRAQCAGSSRHHRRRRLSAGGRHRDPNRRDPIRRRHAVRFSRSYAGRRPHP